jgi:hypothetical protein
MSAPGKLVRSSRWKSGPSKGQRQTRKAEKQTDFFDDVVHGLAPIRFTLAL